MCVWTKAHEKAFQELKSYLSSTALLAKPEDGEPLFLYFSISKNDAKALLVKEQNGSQNSVYYVRVYWMLRPGTHILNK